MAWVYRTSRDDKIVNLSPNLGPGTYNLDKKCVVKPNSIPFGSSQEIQRGPQDAATLITPGPGSYADNLKKGWGSPVKKSSATFASKTLRSSGDNSINTTNSNNTVTQTPGPGAYSHDKQFGLGQERKKIMGKSTNQDQHRQQKVKWVRRLPTAPSIPSFEQSFGYQHDNQGNLVQYKPPQFYAHSGREGVDTLGPGEYEPMRVLQNLSKGRAADFGKSKVVRIIEREIQARASLPGPGEYQNTTTRDTVSQRPSAVFKSPVLNERSSNSAVNNVPGPGAYDENMKTFSKDIAAKEKPAHLQFFGSTTTRFNSNKQTLPPGPGTYYSAPTLMTAPPTTNYKSQNATFLSRSTRCIGNVREEYTAAPGSYNIPSSLGSLPKHLQRVQPFGSTTKRFVTENQVSISTTETSLSPTPKMCSATAKQPSKKKKVIKTQSPAFASVSARFNTISHKTSPSPGDYNILPTWTAVGATGAFKSSTTRLHDSAKQNIPGPGSYTTVTNLKKPLHIPRSDVFCNAEPRFKEIKTSKDRVPGPGQYCTDTVDTDWNRPTYNITIATEMEFALLP